MKTHLHLAITDLEKSVAFYSTLLNATPAKLLSDYALFVTDEPALELALDLREVVALSHDARGHMLLRKSDEGLGKRSGRPPMGDLHRARGDGRARQRAHDVLLDRYRSGTFLK